MNWNEKYRIEYIHKLKVVNFLIEGKELIPDVDGRKQIWIQNIFLM